MNKNQIRRLKEIFSEYPAIKLVYFFGSRAINESGPMSDYDFAIYFSIKDHKKMYDIKFKLQDKIGRILKSNDIDIVILNESCGTELKFNIIKDGFLIYEKGPFQVIIEPQILNEYFDFQIMLKRNNLTRV